MSSRIHSALASERIREIEHRVHVDVLRAHARERGRVKASLLVLPDAAPKASHRRWARDPARR